MKRHLTIRRKKNGFTLLEIIITMSIISFLVVAGAGAFMNTQKTARTSKILSDLKAWQGALEAYAANTTGSYPSPSCDPGTQYLPAGIPVHPLTKVAYAPVSCTASAYCICVGLEGGAANTSSNSDGSCDYTAATKAFYCVSSLQ